MQWLHLSLDSFTNNDQSASDVIVPLLKKGDLLIRDLGYFVLSALQQIIDKKAFLISRLRYGVTLYDARGKETGWKDLCKGKGVIDRQVWIGREHKIPVRIIMIPLPAAQAEKRIRKARKDRDKRLNHSNDYYLWLKYNVFITNIGKETLDGREIAEAYKVRWQIEIVFKFWKSNGHLQQALHEGCTNVYRVKTTIYLLLMFFCLVMQKVYIPHHNSIQKHYKKQLSLMKLLAVVCANFIEVISASMVKLKELLVKYCCYERRKNRNNMTEFIMNF